MPSAFDDPSLHIRTQQSAVSYIDSSAIFGDPNATDHFIRLGADWRNATSFQVIKSDGTASLRQRVQGMPDIWVDLVNLGSDCTVNFWHCDPIGRAPAIARNVCYNLEEGAGYESHYDPTSDSLVWTAMSTAECAGARTAKWRYDIDTLSRRYVQVSQDAHKRSSRLLHGGY